MAKPENTFIASIHRHLPPVSEVYRMKNHNEYVAGVADVWYDARRDLWVEYKFLVLPKRPGTVIDLVNGKDPPISALQRDWLLERHRNGRNVWVIVGCKEGGVVYRNTTWELPLTTAQFKEQLRSRAEVAGYLASFLLAPS